ncbi:MAG: CARDB domain-containing protein, partial [Chloroflexota bacterium]|nr:CARDB domain-containing protein [Chloroflexota bacterium]
EDSPQVTDIALNVSLLVLEKPIEPLAAGATVYVRWWPSFSAGSYMAKAEVDPHNLVSETDEGNNILQHPFTVVPATQ